MVKTARKSESNKPAATVAREPRSNPVRHVFLHIDGFAAEYQLSVQFLKLLPRPRPQLFAAGFTGGQR